MSKLDTSIPTYQFEQNSEEIQEILNKVDKIESKVTDLFGKVNTITDDLKNETERREAADKTINNTIGDTNVLDSTNLVDEITDNGSAISILIRTVSDVQKSIDEKIESPDIYTVEAPVPNQTTIDLRDCYGGKLYDYTIYGNQIETPNSHPGNIITNVDGTSIVIPPTITPIIPLRNVKIGKTDVETGYDLVGMRNESDSINFRTGKVTKKYYYWELTGDETWKPHNDGFSCPHNVNFPKVKKPSGNSQIANVRCSHFKTTSYNLNRRPKSDVTHTIIDNSISIPADAEWLAYIKYMSCADAASFKSWLKEQKAKGTPVKIVYEMETPIIESATLSLPEIEIPSGNYSLEISETSISQIPCVFKFSASYRKNKIDNIEENLPNEIIVTKEVEGGQLDISDAANEEIINLRVTGDYNESLVGTSKFWLNKDTINEVELKFTEPLLFGDVFDYQSKTITRCRKKINFANYTWEKMEGKIGYYRTKSIQDMLRDVLSFEYTDNNISNYDGNIEGFFAIDNEDETIYFYIYNNSDTNSEYYNDIIIRHPNATTELAFQSWVKDASIDLIYVLANPVKEMYKPKTYIFKKGENVLRGNIEGKTCAPSHISVTYKADTKLYIDNKFEELQNAILSTGGNV